MVKIAPSILSADFTQIADAVKSVEEAGADLIHVDIMDGHFVPNLTFGPQLVTSLKKKSSLPLDVHLMVENPRHFIPQFREAGADWISFHIETSAHLHKDIFMIKESGAKAGLALNPGTPIHQMNDVLKELDFVLLLSVNPGWGGQKFIPSVVNKIRQLKSWIRGQNLNIEVEVDGGINLENAGELIQSGTDIIVAGAAIFANDNPQDIVLKMKEIAKKFSQP